MENEPKIPVNLPKTDIIVGDTETKVASTNVPVIKPITPVSAQTDSGAMDPLDTQEVVKMIRELTNKSVLIALQKLQEMLPKVKEQDIEKFVNLTLKLLDAQMAFDWSDRFAKTILKNPSLLKTVKGGSRAATAQGNMATMKKLNQGDGRTTPKKLLKDMPQDEEETG